MKDDTVVTIASVSPPRMFMISGELIHGRQYFSPSRVVEFSDPDIESINHSTDDEMVIVISGYRFNGKERSFGIIVKRSASVDLLKFIDAHDLMNVPSTVKIGISMLI